MPILPYLAGYLPGVTVALALALGGAWMLLPPALVWVLVPLADHFGGVETRWGDAPGTQAEAYRWLVRCWVPVQVGLFGWGLYELALPDATWQRTAMLIFDLGVLGGATGITFAHEMMHRSSRLDRGLAEVLMTVVSYPWFCLEHVQGHHKRVATPDDPATARLGETVYGFIPRSYVGGLLSSLRLERRHQAKRGRSLWHPTSRLWRYASLTLACYAGAYALGGAMAALGLLGGGLVSIGLLEGINYLEHYGLQRKLVIGPSGTARYERVAPHHSWNSAHRVSNFMLLNLARHSDHHAHAARSWEQLRHLDSAPQLPSGYGAMFLLAFVPPLWFRVMDPLVRDWRSRFLGTTPEEPPAHLGHLTPS